MFSHIPGPFDHDVSEHYTGLSMDEVTHKASLCDCELVRSLDDGTVRIYQCTLHESAPELLQALKDLTKEVKLFKLNIRKDFSLINAHASATRAIYKVEHP